MSFLLVLLPHVLVLGTAGGRNLGACFARLHSVLQPPKTVAATTYVVGFRVQVLGRSRNLKKGLRLGVITAPPPSPQQLGRWHILSV